MISTFLPRPCDLMVAVTLPPVDEGSADFHIRALAYHQYLVELDSVAGAAVQRFQPQRITLRHPILFTARLDYRIHFSNSGTKILH